MLLSKFEQNQMQEILKNKERKQSQQKIIDQEIQNTQDWLKDNIFYFNIPSFFQWLRSYEELDVKFKSGYQKNAQIDKLQQIEKAIQTKYQSDANVFEYLAYLRLTTQSKLEMREFLKDELQVDINPSSFQIFFVKWLEYQVHDNSSKNIDRNDNEEEESKVGVDRDISIQKRMDAILRKNFSIN